MIERGPRLISTSDMDECILIVEEIWDVADSPCLAQKSELVDRLRLVGANLEEVFEDSTLVGVDSSSQSQLQQARELTQSDLEVHQYSRMLLDGRDLLFFG